MNPTRYYQEHKICPFCGSGLFNFYDEDKDSGLYITQCSKYCFRLEDGYFEYRLRPPAARPRIYFMEQWYFLSREEEILLQHFPEYKEENLTVIIDLCKRLHEKYY